MVHTVCVSEAALSESMTKLLLEDVASVSVEANWWHPRVRVIESWLREDAKRAGVPDDGADEMLRRLVERGDLHPQAQLKCWQHILLELRDVACFKDALLAKDMAGGGSGGASPSRGKLRPGKELIILSDAASPEIGGREGQGASLASSTTASVSEKAPVAVMLGARKARPSSSAERRPGADTADGAKAFSGLSMMERQAEWLRKKQDKVEAERQRQEEEKERELTFQPKIIRRVTFGEGDKSWKEAGGSLSLSAAAAAPRVLRRGESLGSSRKPDGAALSVGPKEKAIPKPPRPGRPRSKRRKSQPLGQGASVSQPIEIPSGLLESMKSELKASKAAGHRSVATEESDDGESDEDGDEDAAPSVEADADAESDAVEEQSAAAVKSWSERPTIGGRRVDFDSGETKARLVLQDASRFDLTSMYRKTDRKAGRDGVALHMGRREDTFEEEVIAVLFDKEKVSELEAARWWVDHEHRFAEFMREPVVWQ